MALRFEGTGFGWIRLGGEVYGHDIVVFGGERVEERRKELSRRGLGHTPLSRRELEEYLRGLDVKIVLVGTGQYGALPVDEADRLCREWGIEFIAERTEKAGEIYNRLLREGRRDFVAIFHVTC
ncbi:MAG: hypothetical protein DRO06_01145 [Thermoproteota archaeon]|nr:MAG: hypothetical protein DRO06_01145 [Candidatus Korarchaeota archaeon]